MGLRNIIVTTALVSGALAYGNNIKRGAMHFISGNNLPAVNVDYRFSGTYVNGERVDAQGRVGGPRCDWNEIEIGQQEYLVYSALQRNPAMLNRYIRDSPTQDQRNIAYISLLSLARRAGNSVSEQVQTMRDALGFRWELQYQERAPSVDTSSVLK